MTDPDDERPITIRCEHSGEWWDFYPPDGLWRDMQAFCAASGLRMEELIRRAIDDFISRKTQ